MVLITLKGYLKNSLFLNTESNVHMNSIVNVWKQFDAMCIHMTKQSKMNLHYTGKFKGN